MRDNCTDLKFNGCDSQIGKHSLESTLALVNHSNSSDKKATEDATKFTEAYNIDFHSEDKDVPRELPALYDDVAQGRTQLTIYSPRDGYIKDVTENPEAPEELRESITPKGKDKNWMYFSSAQTDYAVKI
ncbi:hypothetical protein ACFLZJ_01125 [Nanoarchaeota archaeon]